MITSPTWAIRDSRRSKHRSCASSASSTGARSRLAPRTRIRGIVAAIRALCPVLVGRESELTELEDSLLAAARGEGRMVLIAGEAGIGKTRLASEARDRARGLGMKVFHGALLQAALGMADLVVLGAVGY